MLQKWEIVPRIIEKWISVRMLNKAKRFYFDMEEEDFEDNEELSHEDNVRHG